MTISPRLPLFLTCCALLVGCKPAPESFTLGGENAANPDQASASASSPSSSSIEADQLMAAVQPAPGKDLPLEQLLAFRRGTRQAYNNRRFDELEKSAANLRAGKLLFGNGAWRLFHFYECLQCHEEEPESMWQLHDAIHKEWIAAKPQSVTARVAHADFLKDYAWHARGSDVASKVSEEGRRLFKERLSAALKALGEAKAMPEKDPVLFLTGLTIARGQGLSKPGFDELVNEAHAAEPTFWHHDAERANSLSTRWHGQPGEWEAFAEQAAARPGGLGAEGYARIVISQRRYHNHMFRETKASWPKVREGLGQMHKKYPGSLEIVSHTAIFAAMAGDIPLAKAMFAKLGDTHVPGVWRNPEERVKVKAYVEAAP